MSSSESSHTETSPTSNASEPGTSQSLGREGQTVSGATAAPERVMVPTVELAELVKVAARAPRTIKAPKYSEHRDIAEYLTDFQLVAEKNEWSDLEAGIELQNCLEGTPLTLALASSSSGKEIRKCLEDKLTPSPKDARRLLQNVRMIHGDVEGLAKKCRRYTEVGYGPRGLNVAPEVMEEQQVEAFMEGLRDRDMVHALGIQKPNTLEQAVQLAKEFIQREEQFKRKIRCMHCEESDTKPEATASGNGRGPRL